MRLPRFTDYGFRTLIYLAAQQAAGAAKPALASIAEIAAAYGVSEHHMTKVIHALGRAGLVETLRGRNGGLRLAQPPHAIQLGQVVRAIEPELALVECQNSQPCAIDGVCHLHGLMDEALAALFAVLDRHSLADLLGPERQALQRRLGLAAPPPRGAPQPAA
jgi:Rrf2 family nitric oxide-sensitive transcriptional repressor